MKLYPGIDRSQSERVEAMIEGLRSSGHVEAADLFKTTYWAWLKVVQAYVLAHPYVASPEPGATPISSLHVVDMAVRYWSPLVPGTPVLDDDAVLEAARDDEAWHRAEELRMRRTRKKTCDRA